MTKKEWIATIPRKSVESRNDAYFVILSVSEISKVLFTYGLLKKMRFSSLRDSALAESWQSIVCASSVPIWIATLTSFARNDEVAMTDKNPPPNPLRTGRGNARS